MPTEIAEEFAFIEGLLKTGLTYIQTYSWQFLAAIILLIIGIFISNKIHKLVIKAGTKSKMDVTLLHFLAGLGRVTVIAFTIMITLSKLGITIAPLIAAVSAGIFGATFAIQAPVANYASGLIIIITRPFKLGHVVTIQGRTGRVESITLAMTFLRAEDGEQIQIPNKFIMGEILENSGDFRLVENQIGISYSSDTDKAITIIEEIIQEHDSIEHEGSLKVGISSFEESTIVISYRYRVLEEKRHDVQYSVNSKVFSAIREAGIVIPFPQRIITMKQE